MSARRNPDAALLSAYLEGEVTASERASIEAELNESAEARRTLAQLRDVRALLSAPEAELESMDLPSRVRAAVRQPAAGPATLSSGRRARSMMPLWLGGVAASAALVALFAFSSKQEGNDAEFRAKGSELRVSEGSRWAGI
ncbi:MAG TPA: hypothetical protein VFQ35_14290, partial [Polyangiaceae bacterium]|nr:hypothetical protein [Polyangiaceae bacterium]